MFNLKVKEIDSMFKKKTFVLMMMAAGLGASSAVMASGFVAKPVVPVAQGTQITQTPISGRVIDQSSSAAQTPVMGSVTHRGTPFANRPVVSGTGVNVTLRDALLQIVPTSWNVYDGTGHVDMSVRLDWSGGTDWAGVLGSIAAKIGIHAIIDWDAKEIVLLRTAAPAIKQATQPAPAAAMNSIARMASHCDINQGAVDTWAINAGDTIGDVFQRWSKQSGKRFIVDLGVRNHPINETVTIRGTLNFAMKQLIDATNMSMRDNLMFNGCNDRVEVWMGQ